MSVNLEDVKKLRKLTNAGFGDCKKALELSSGNIDGAVKKLKEMGVTSAEKRISRDTNEGRIFAYKNEKRAGLLLVACETDFVSLSDKFTSFFQNFLKDLIESSKNEIDEEREVQIKELIGIMKENIHVSKFEFMKIDDNEIVQDYIHGEGKIGVLVKIKVEDKNLKSSPILKELVSDLSLHIAAFSPFYLSLDKVPQSYKDEQEQIFTKQLGEAKKPENIIKNIVAGKVNKSLASVVLLEQNFIKDDKITVLKKLEAVGRELNTKISITDFKYISVV